MGFKSVNELEQFCFDDCQICEIKVSDKEVDFVLEALIVKRNNSQNTNFTESYAGTTSARFFSGSIVKGFKDGYKYYNADDVLLKEVEDVLLTETEMRDILNSSSGAYLYSFDKDKEENGRLYYTFGIEFVDELENTMSDSYHFQISFEKAVFEWEHYMNRVQH